MAKRTFALATIACLFVFLGSVAAIADEEVTSPAQAQPAAQAQPTAQAQQPAQQQPKPTEVPKAPATTQAPSRAAANGIGVCACGKAFVPTASTQTFTYNGKTYASCSDACHKLAMSDPAGGSKKADEQVSKAMSKLAAGGTSATPAATPSKPQ